MGRTSSGHGPDEVELDPFKALVGYAIQKNIRPSKSEKQTYNTYVIKPIIHVVKYI